MMGTLKDLKSWNLIEAGSPAPRLSLTADEGTWIRLQDFKDHIHSVLIFFQSLNDDATDAALQQFNQRREQFKELDTAIFGITSYRPEKLRDFRASLGLEFSCSTTLGDGCPWLPCFQSGSSQSQNHIYVVGKSGNILGAWRGLPDAQEVLNLIAQTEGVTAQQSAPAAQPTADVPTDDLAAFATPVGKRPWSRTSTPTQLSKCWPQRTTALSYSMCAPVLNTMRTTRLRPFTFQSMNFRTDTKR